MRDSPLNAGQIAASLSGVAEADAGDDVDEAVSVADVGASATSLTVDVVWLGVAVASCDTFAESEAVGVVELSEDAADSVLVAVDVDDELFESLGLDDSVGVLSSVVEVEVVELSVAVALELSVAVALELSVEVLSSLAVCDAVESEPVMVASDVV